MREASKYQAVSTIGVVWTGHRDLGRTTYADVISGAVVRALTAGRAAPTNPPQSNSSSLDHLDMPAGL